MKMTVIRLPMMVAMVMGQCRWRKRSFRKRGYVVLLAIDVTMIW